MVDHVLVEPVTDQNADQALEFLVDAVTGDEADARRHLADHPSGAGTSLLAVRSGTPIGIATIRWTSDYPGFRERGIPLLHQIAVHEDVRRAGVASALMDAIEAAAAQRGAASIGTTVGLADSYGPAMRMYAKRGYVPDGRGACMGQRPVRLGESVTVDHDLILWLTKDLIPEPA